MRDEICYEEQAPALTGYQIANIRDSTLDPLVSTYMITNLIFRMGPTVEGM